MKLEVVLYTELLLMQDLSRPGEKYYETLFKWVNKMKVYAKGCDAPGCSQEAEVDQGLGRPEDWYFITVDGGSRKVKKTIIVCRKCYEGPMATSVLMQLPVVAL